MHIHMIWHSNDPALHERLRLANEERAALMRGAFKSAFGALWFGLAAPFHWAAEAMKRGHARSRAAEALHALDDRMLSDIGLHRSEISEVARLSAALPPDTRLSIRDLRTAADAGTPRPPLRNDLPETSKPATAFARRARAAASRCTDLADGLVHGTPARHAA